MAAGMDPPRADVFSNDPPLCGIVFGDFEYIRQKLTENCEPPITRYLACSVERLRIREHMKTALLMDVPTSRCFSREYYLEDPYLDVRFGTEDGWCWGRFIHDPLWEDIETGLPIGDTLIVGFVDWPPPRRVRCSPALMRAIQRVLYEP